METKQNKQKTKQNKTKQITTKNKTNIKQITTKKKTNIKQITTKTKHTKQITMKTKQITTKTKTNYDKRGVYVCEDVCNHTHINQDETPQHVLRRTLFWMHVPHIVIISRSIRRNGIMYKNTSKNTSTACFHYFGLVCRYPHPKQHHVFFISLKSIG